MQNTDFVHGRNYKSVRIARIKDRMKNFNSLVDLPYTRACALLRELLTIRTISSRNCAFARKFIGEKMQPFFRDPQSVEEMNQLELLFQKAEERREKRRQKKLALKAAGTGKRCRKPKPAAVPVVVDRAKDPWDIPGAKS